MTLQLSYFSLLLFLSAMITAILALYGWRHRDVSISRPFTLLMAAATLWTLGEAVQALNVDLATALIANTLEYPGIVTVPVAWFLLALFYTGRESWVTRRRLLLLFVVPAISVFFAATNPYNLFYPTVTPFPFDGITLWHYEHGPLFDAMVLYTYLLAIIAFFLVLIKAFDGGDPYHRQTLILLFASAIPFGFDVLYVSQPVGGPVFDVTPFSFMIMGVLIALGILRYRLFATVPVAHSVLFRSMSDAVFVTDIQDRIVDLNPAAARIVGKDAHHILGTTLQETIPGLIRPGPADFEQEETKFEVTVTLGDGNAEYEVSYIPLYSRTTEIGHLIVLHDITARHAVQAALKVANTKLNLLSEITRHDVMNQLTVLLGNLELSRQATTDPDVRAWIAKEERSALTIRQQIAFTSEYQDIGKQSPTWQSVRETFLSAARKHTTGDITFTADTGTLEIFSDPLFEKVFYNLIDNSLRHGGIGMKTIGIASEEDPEGLTILYKDDGEGIAEEDKPRIFERGFGKTGGMGLFLVREILAITGITISEKGEPGKGARFEIRAPKGAYRAPVTR
ncbi:MAG: ATP-binding protein [Methanolinea sp.]|nr:ATP-binding protein [Methanolinea sp.]